MIEKKNRCVPECRRRVQLMPPLFCNAIIPLLWINLLVSYSLRVRFPVVSRDKVDAPLIQGHLDFYPPSKVTKEALLELRAQPFEWRQCEASRGQSNSVFYVLHVEGHGPHERDPCLTNIT